MRQSYLKNAALLTGSDVVLRLAGMGLRIWLANELGGEGKKKLLSIPLITEQLEKIAEGLF